MQHDHVPHVGQDQQIRGHHDHVVLPQQMSDAQTLFEESTRFLYGNKVEVATRPPRVDGPQLYGQGGVSTPNIGQPPQYEDNKMKSQGGPPPSGTSLQFVSQHGVMTPYIAHDGGNEFLPPSIGGQVSHYNGHNILVTQRTPPHGDHPMDSYGNTPLRGHDDSRETLSIFSSPLPSVGSPTRFYIKDIIYEQKFGPLALPSCSPPKALELKPPTNEIKIYDFSSKLKEEDYDMVETTPSQPYFDENVLAEFSTFKGVEDYVKDRSVPIEANFSAIFEFMHLCRETTQGLLDTSAKNNKNILEKTELI